MCSANVRRRSVRHGFIRHKQNGSALILLMLIVIVGAAAVLVSKVSGNSNSLTNSNQSQHALSAAKKALLAYASSSAETVPGTTLTLPCPDIDETGPTLDGEAHTSACGSPGVTILGRLPWRTLNISAPFDGASECLWYAVSGEYKAAGSSTSTMINPDSNGQLELYQKETGILVEGVMANERPVAIVMAPGALALGQTRQASSPPELQCSDDFAAASFLDADGGSGISNAATIGSVGVDQFVRSFTEQGDFNDRVVTISRLELANHIYGRHDFATRIRDLAQTIASCVAVYGQTNPGGANDNRLPWPASVGLGDYRVTSQYDDIGGSAYSGRLADIVDDSNAATGNLIARLLSDCDPVAVPNWTAAVKLLWENWKDHFFYFVAESYSPTSSVPSVCGNCVSINGAGQYAAAILFANRRLPLLTQLRDAPPIDTDTRSAVVNYLEGANSASHPYISGSVDLESRPADSSFNDIVFCIDTAMNVVAC